MMMRKSHSRKLPIRPHERGFINLLPAGGRQSVDIGDPIAHSARFRGNASPNMVRIMPSGGSPAKFSISWWGKRGAVDASSGRILYTSYQDASNYSTLGFNYDGNIIYSELSSGVNVWAAITKAQYRDPSSFLHIYLEFESTHATTTERIRLWVNGMRVTAFNSISYPASGNSSWFGTPGIYQVVGAFTSSAANFDGVFARLEYLHGLVFNGPSNFGRVSSGTGAWVNKSYAGSFPGNSFSLRFESVSIASDFGIDSSGNGNTFNVSNLSATVGVTYDWLTDTPTNNYATLNPLTNLASGSTIGEGNLYFAAGGHRSIQSSIGMTDGKWYAEITFDPSGIAGGIGVTSLSHYSVAPATAANVWWVYDNNVNFGILNQTTVGSYSPRFTSGATWRICVDVRAGQVFIGDHLGNWIDSANGSTGNPSTGANPTFGGVTANAAGGSGQLFFMSENAGVGAMRWNFGQSPFVTAPPTGFKTLCTANMPDLGIPKSSAGFNTLLYSGNSAARSLTGAGFAPDLAIVKARSGGSSAAFLASSLRGPTKFIYNNTDAVEQVNANTLTSFDSDGVSLGNDASGIGFNITGYTYFINLWKKAARFGHDQVQYTGTGVNRTIAHSLGATPSMILVKNLTVNARSTCVYHKNLGSGTYLPFNFNYAPGTSSAVWNNTAPTSSDFTVGTDTWVNENGATYEALLFTDVPGFSKFGAYTGNGTTDGPFVSLGFRPRWIMIRRTDTTGDWTVIDTARNPYNLAGIETYLELVNNEAAGNNVDLMSNGFKLRNTNAWVNASGGTYVYMAFAETPFKYANAR